MLSISEDSTVNSVTIQAFIEYLYYGNIHYHFTVNLITDAVALEKQMLMHSNRVNELKEPMLTP